MSWWDTNQITNFATTALKNAQKKIDKALDIKEEESETGLPKAGTTEVAKEQPRREAAEKGENFWSAWGLGAGEDSEVSTHSELSVKSGRGSEVGTLKTCELSELTSTESVQIGALLHPANSDASHEGALVDKPNTDTACKGALLDQANTDTARKGALLDQANTDTARKGALVDKPNTDTACKGALLDQANTDTARKGALLDQANTDTARKGALLDKANTDTASKGALLDQANTDTGHKGKVKEADNTEKECLGEVLESLNTETTYIVEGQVESLNAKTQTICDQFESVSDFKLDGDGWSKVELLSGESKFIVPINEQSAISSPEQEHTKTLKENSNTHVKTWRKSTGPVKLGSHKASKTEQCVPKDVTENEKYQAAMSECVTKKTVISSLEKDPKTDFDKGKSFALNVSVSSGAKEIACGEIDECFSIKNIVSGVGHAELPYAQRTNRSTDGQKDTAWGDDISLSILGDGSLSTESQQKTLLVEQETAQTFPKFTESGFAETSVNDKRGRSEDCGSTPTEENTNVTGIVCKLQDDTDVICPNIEEITKLTTPDGNANDVEALSEHMRYPPCKDFAQELHVDTMSNIVAVCPGNKEVLEAVKLTVSDEDRKRTTEEEWLKFSASNEQSLETSDELSESNKTLTSSESNRTLEGDSIQLQEEDDSGMTGKDCTQSTGLEQLSPGEGVLSSSSYVKCMLEEAMTESVKENESPTASHASSDMVRVESGHTSGHTSADEIDTTTSSDIEIISHISTPTPNGENSTFHGPFDLSPLRHALSRSVRTERSGHKRSDSSSSGTSFPSHNGDEQVSPDSCPGCKTEGVKDKNQAENSAEDHQTVENPLDVEKLLKKLAELAEVLDAREKKLVELSRENINLVESNSILRSQLQQSEEAHESEQTDVNAAIQEFTMRISESEKKNNQILKEKDVLKKQLQDAETEIIKKSDKTTTERLIAEKDQQIAELMEEGEKLSKQQLQSNNIIKKLRTKEKESENRLKTNNIKLEDQKAENEKLKKVLDNKIDNEKIQTESVQQLNAAMLQLESERSRIKSELEDYQERNRSMQVALDNSYKEMAGLHKAKAAHASETQSIALSAEMAAKEALRLALDRKQVQARQEQESLVTQIEDLQLSVRRMEKEHGRREDALRQEISDLQQRLVEAEERNQDLTTSVSAATRPLLRQIENLQSTYSAQTSSYERVERNLTERLADAQGLLATAVEKERAVNESLMEATTRITALESQMSSLRQEKSRLQAYLDMERTKTALMEDSKNNEMAQLETLKRGYEHELCELRQNKAILENQLEMEKLRVEAEKKKLTLAHDQLKDKENQLVQMQTRSISPPMYFHEGKLLSSMAAESPVAISAMSLSALSANQSEDMMENSLMTSSVSSNKMSLYDSLRQSGAATLTENLQSQLKQKEGEIAQLQSEICELEGTREALARELVDITSKNQELELHLKGYPEIQKSYTELDQRYNAILQMYGEKVEEADELRLDLHDVKVMYKGQIEHLLKSMGH